MHDYDVENQFELGDLVEDSDEAEEGGRKRTSFDGERRAANGYTSGGARVKKESVHAGGKDTERSI